MLAGGLTADNVSEGIRIFEPDIVDVSSGVENETGKDEKVRRTGKEHIKRKGRVIYEQESILWRIWRTVCCGISDEYIGGIGRSV